MEYEDATYAVVESNTPFGVDITYTYNAFTSTLETAWDFADLELDGTNPDVVITSDRDSSGFLLWEQASVAGTADYRNDYQFDGYGRPVTVTQDAVTGGNTVEKKRVEFSYNLKSRLAAIDRYLYETDGTTLDPVASSSYSYTDGDLTGLVHFDPLEAILREYDWTYQAGRIVGETVDDDTRAFTYDADGQLKTVTAVPPGGSTPVETEFVYDATGNRDEIKEDDVQVADYEVDDFNRVTFDGTYHYDYDPEGNRTARFVDGTPANGTLDSGDTNWTVYTWDHRNRLISVESGVTYGTTDVTVTFGYDWLNRWISTEVDYAVGTDTSEYFVYGVAAPPDSVTSWDRAAADARNIGQITLRLDETQKITNRYLWGPAVDQILADEQVDWNAGAQDYDIDQILWPLTDHLGTIRDLAAVNATSGATEVVNHRDYDACGLLLAETDDTVDHLFGFTGRASQTDAGLQNNLGRWYDPEIASWTTQDPINFRGGDANLYRYCGNDPVNSVDPAGLKKAVYVTREGAWGYVPLYGQYLTWELDSREIAKIESLKAAADGAAALRKAIQDARDELIAQGASASELDALCKELEVDEAACRTYISDIENWTPLQPRPANGAIVTFDFEGYEGRKPAWKKSVNLFLRAGEHGFNVGLMQELGASFGGTAGRLRFAVPMGGAMVADGGVVTLAAVRTVIINGRAVSIAVSGGAVVVYATTPGGRELTLHAEESLPRHGFNAPYRGVDHIIDNAKWTTKQADGATVHILRDPGRGRTYSIVVESEGRIVTAMRGLTPRELRNLARNHGFGLPF